MQSHFICDTSDLLVFSHLRWDFVFQRPQHLLSRFAGHRRVYFFEEPIFTGSKIPYLNLKMSNERVMIAVPHLPRGLTPDQQIVKLQKLVDDLVLEEQLEDYNSWYYTPMALPFSRHLKPHAILYDMMDELSTFKGAPKSLVDLEAELLEKADLVFTGGHSLFEAKQTRHKNIHPFPSSIDFNHFAKARGVVSDPEDQAHIPYPRVGFFGVIDERMDIELLREAALVRPDLQFVILGPVVKIDPESLPKADNIHYLGMKSYQQLPQYLAGWDCGMMPFALNESTRFISPTKTPEYLAAGKPVVSTRIYDVVRPYEELGLVRIADNVHEFIEHIDAGIIDCQRCRTWINKVDSFLSTMSWDLTWQKIANLEKRLVKKNKSQSKVSAPVMSHLGNRNQNYADRIVTVIGPSS
jgi:glycosyltransferase involved in cell wall biosynthesis